MVAATKPDSFQLPIIIMSLYIFSNLKLSTGLDTLSPGQALYENQTLISQGRKFELGFFSPGNSTKSYVGIWYYNIPGDKTVVWVANRESPIRKISNSSRLVLDEDGSLKLYSGFEILWATNTSVAKKGVLLDEGNFILSDGLSVVWQSFDYPTDTWLPGAKLGNNESLILTSWKNPNDPAPGIYSFGMNPKGDPELFIWKNSSQILWRSGVWNGLKFDSFPTGPAYFWYTDNDQAKNFTYNIAVSLTSRYVMTYWGQINQWVRTKNQNWTLHASQPADYCNTFGRCGPNGVCDISSSPICDCLNGFVPRSLDWQKGDWSGGCVRTNPLQCSSVDFSNTSGVSMPANSLYSDSESDQVCRYACLANCKCTAYAYNYGRCSLWIGDLLDTRETVGDGKSQGNLYLRSSEVLLASKRNCETVQ